MTLDLSLQPLFYLKFSRTLWCAGRLRMSGMILTHNNLAALEAVQSRKLTNLENPGCYLRACFLDFCKPFDRINHNIVIERLTSLKVGRSIIPWISSFLTGPRQALKIGSTVLQWLPNTASVAQSTKLGPILLIIMINDLRVSSSKASDRKYVDDLTFSEVVQDITTVPKASQHLTKKNSWASKHDMRLNPSKCKELIRNFSHAHEPPHQFLVLTEHHWIVLNVIRFSVLLSNLT